MRMTGARVWGSRASWNVAFLPHPSQINSLSRSRRRTTKIVPQEQGTPWAPGGISGGGLDFDFILVLPTRVRPFLAGVKKSVTRMSSGLGVGPSGKRGGAGFCAIVRLLGSFG